LEFITYTGKSGPDDNNITDIVDSLFTNLETYNNERDKRIPSETNEMSAGGGGKRKYKADVNQKSLKKFSTIIKKLLNINLNIKLAAKPKAKPKAKQATKPTSKPKAKPKAKTATKPKAKPTAKPKAKPAAKPKAKPAAKPKAKPAAKPVAKK
jgi:outer membrane biosynthesis protein TonB